MQATFYLSGVEPAHATKTVELEWPDVQDFFDAAVKVADEAKGVAIARQYTVRGTVSLPADRSNPEWGTDKVTVELKRTAWREN